MALNRAVRNIARGFDESPVGKANLALQRRVGKFVLGALRGGLTEATGGELRANKRSRERTELLKKQLKALKK